LPACDQVTAAARLEKKKAIARQRAEQIAAELRSAPISRGPPPPPFAGDHPWPLHPPQSTELVRRGRWSWARRFGLRVGERSGLIAGELGYYLIESIARKQADSTACWRSTTSNANRCCSRRDRRGMQAYLTGLRQQAKVVDRRKDLFRPQQNTTAGS